MSETRVPSERYAQGMATRRSVLGDAHVDRAQANKTAFDALPDDLPRVPSGKVRKDVLRTRAKDIAGEMAA